MAEIFANVETTVEEMLGDEAEKIVYMLDTAAASEILAVIQYKMAAAVVVGNTAQDVADHLLEHAQQELEHWSMLIKRIVELGFTPATDLDAIVHNKFTSYLNPSDRSPEAIIDQTIESESGAIQMYNSIAEYVKDKDSVTYDLVVSILAQEQEHERDFITLQENLG